MANGNKSASKLIWAIDESQGFVSKAAELLEISRQTFYNWLKEFPTAAQHLKDVRSKRHDFVELQLMKGIKEGNMTAIIFYLKTQCKQRGYVERQELTGPDNNEIVFKVIRERVSDKDTNAA